MDEEDDQQQNLSITDILSGAQTINRELEALQREHNALITKTMLVEEDQCKIQSLVCNSSFSFSSLR